MPNWTDTLNARERGDVEGFIGKDENIDPDALEQPEEQRKLDEPQNNELENGDAEHLAYAGT